jgi:hypothetical protein
MRRTLPAIVALALCCAPVGLGATSSPSSPANQGNSLTIVTVPPLPGVRFAVGDQVIETGRDGTASVGLSGPGEYPLRIVDEAVRHGAVRSRFSRWGDNSFTPSRAVDVHGAKRLEVGFQQSVLVGFQFVDRANHAVDSARVSKLSLASTIGTRQTFEPSRPRWLIAGRVTRRFRGLEQTRIQYAVEKAVVDGSNVVNRAQQRFYPLRQRTVALRLLLYSARLSAHDFLFGFPIGRRVDLVYPNGHRVVRNFKGGKLLLRDLPRGTYGIRVQAGGYSPLVSLALSKDQKLKLKVVSYLDLFVVAVVALTAAALLVLLPRPALRRKLRELAAEGVTGARTILVRASSRVRLARRSGSRAGPRGAETAEAGRRAAGARGGDAVMPDSSDCRVYIETLVAHGIGPTRGLTQYREAGGAMRANDWFAEYRAVEERLRLRRQAVARTLSSRRSRFPGVRTLSTEQPRPSLQAIPSRELD